MADTNPYLIERPQQQQQGPMGGMGGGQGGGGLGGIMQMFGGETAATGATTSATTGGGLTTGGATAGIGGGTTAAAGGGAAGGSAAGGGASGGTALASTPVGWVVAAAIAQNVAHNKGISSWADAIKGQGGRNIGEHFMDQWGVNDDGAGGVARDIAGVAGWGEGGGILNPGNLNKKIEDLFS